MSETSVSRAALDEILFIIGDMVYLKIQPWDHRTSGMVTGIRFYPGGHHYQVTWADNRQETSHYEIELTRGDE